MRIWSASKVAVAVAPRDWIHQTTAGVRWVARGVWSDHHQSAPANNSNGRPTVQTADSLTGGRAWKLIRVSNYATHYPSRPRSTHETGLPWGFDELHTCEQSWPTKYLGLWDHDHAITPHYVLRNGPIVVLCVDTHGVWRWGGPPKQWSLSISVCLSVCHECVFTWLWLRYIRTDYMCVGYFEA